MHLYYVCMFYVFRDILVPGFTVFYWCSKAIHRPRGKTEFELVSYLTFMRFLAVLYYIHRRSLHVKTSGYFTFFQLHIVLEYKTVSIRVFSAHHGSSDLA